MKRKLLILSALAICIAMLAAGTLAYFTSEGKAHNVITTGGVKIAVQEWA
ncbi:MAG: SipW-dependent-type signal peptide-containing protein, partial [Prevotella pectinovora]